MKLMLGAHTSNTSKTENPQPFEEIIIFRLTTSSETISKSIARKADSGANQQFESSFSGSLDVNVTYDDGGQGIIKGQYNYQTDKY